MEPGLKQCASCGTFIDIDAETCWQCGTRNKQPVTKKWWFWAVVIFIGIGILSNLGSGNGDSGSSPSGNNVSVSSVSLDSNLIGDSGSSDDGASPVLIDEAEAKTETIEEADDLNAFQTESSDEADADSAQSPYSSNGSSYSQRESADETEDGTSHSDEEMNLFIQQDGMNSKVSRMTGTLWQLRPPDVRDDWKFAQKYGFSEQDFLTILKTDCIEYMMGGESTYAHHWKELDDSV
jgi:hypothetical protein